MDDRTLHIPDKLSAQGRAAAEVILRLAQQDERTETGGCRAFYSPREWKERGEKFGADSLLVVVHDGSDLAAYFNYDREDYDAIERMDNALEEIGLMAQSCTGWYTAIYTTHGRASDKENSPWAER
jgi:hypothetical protein